jgi:hypothetical protein
MAASHMMLRAGIICARAIALQNKPAGDQSRQ